MGDPNDSAAGQLFSPAQRVYEPRKIIHFEQPGRYPERERPALYICNDDACSLPIYDAELVREEARKSPPLRSPNKLVVFVVSIPAVEGNLVQRSRKAGTVLLEARIVCVQYIKYVQNGFMDRAVLPFSICHQQI